MSKTLKPTNHSRLTRCERSRKTQPVPVTGAFEPGPAREQIRQAQDGHLPTLDLTALPEFLTPLTAVRKPVVPLVPV